MKKHFSINNNRSSKKRSLTKSDSNLENYVNLNSSTYQSISTQIKPPGLKLTRSELRRSPNNYFNLCESFGDLSVDNSPLLDVSETSDRNMITSDESLTF